jgi:glucosamine--fructose-6-phosphate aminotransferase (isomerizing)
MSSIDLTSRQLLTDTFGIPETLAARLPAVERAIARELDAIDPKPKRLIVLSGSGDLLHAALCMQFAMERLTGVPTIALPSMQTGLYRTPSLPENSVVLQMSFSGITARAVEAATLAKKRGAEVWAITAQAESRLARLADRHFLKPPTGENEAVGFQITMAMLLLIGIGLAERSGTISVQTAAHLRASITSSTSDMRRTLDMANPLAKQAADQIKAAPHLLFLASGPTFGTAVNASARVMEAAGASAAAQDIEEWVHLERWIADKALPVIVIVSPGPGMDRALEVVQALHRLQKMAFVVTSDRAADRFRVFCPVLPVVTDLPEELSPLVYNLPCELLADHMCAALDRHPYRSDDPLYSVLGEIRWGGHIRTEMP